jgi:hypothetical protein
MRGAAVALVVALIACGGDDATTGGSDAGQDGARPRDAIAAMDGRETSDGGSDAGPPPPPTCDPPTAGHHVAPDGTAAGDGSAASPWDLATALAHPATVAAGDTIWLRAGTYRGTFTSTLAGTAEAPIVVRAEPGARVTIDAEGSRSAVLTIQGEHAWYWGLEVTNSAEERNTSMTGSSSDVPRGEGIGVFARGVRVIHTVVHDNAQGIGFWSPAIDAELYGNVIYNNGWNAPDRAHGHAIYTQNAEGRKRIAENVLFHGFSYGIHAYTEGGSIVGFDYVGNVFWQNGVGAEGTGTRTDNLLHGGLQPADGVVVRESFGWAPPDERSVRLGYSDDFTNGSIEVRDNYLVGDTGFPAAWSSVTMSGNTFLGDVTGVDPAAHPDNEYLAAAPTETRVFVRGSSYETGRGHVIVYNWGDDDEATVDLAAILAAGTAYEVHNAEDYYAAPVASGTYDGAPVVLPLRGLSVAQPVGTPAAIDPSETAGDRFRVFVVTPICR